MSSDRVANKKALASFSNPSFSRLGRVGLVGVLRLFPKGFHSHELVRKNLIRTAPVPVVSWRAKTARWRVGRSLSLIFNYTATTRSKNSSASYHQCELLPPAATPTDTTNSLLLP